MSRLFTFGCSFTNYSWPSWADFLGLDFDHYENWACPGLGNRAIAERITECNVKNKFTNNDLVIVQWTSHLRNDYHTERRRLNYKKGGPFKSQFGWKTGGGIFNYINQEIYNTDWIRIFFDEKSFLMHTLNNISSAQHLLDNTGCTWLMTSAAKIDALGNDIPDPMHGEMITKKDNSYSIWNDAEYQKFEAYKSAIWGKYQEHWLEPVGSFAWSIPDKQWTFLGHDNEPWVELHPSPVQHLEFVNTVIKPKLNFDLNEKYVPMLQLTDYIKVNTADIHGFEAALMQYWQPKYYGM